MIRKNQSFHKPTFLAVTLVFVLWFMASAASSAVFINEIHYDNTGTDEGEAIEIAGPAGTDLTGWSLVLYNGSNGAVYDTTTLNGTIPDFGSGFGVVFVSYPTNGIQNGSPDGLALVDSGSNVIQFLSYEGTFTAVGGPANGMSSVDIGVSEGSGTAVGDSLQLIGTGTMGGDFTWAASQPNTFGLVNTGQTFGSVTGPTDPLINEYVANHTGVDSEAFVEVFGDPSTDYSLFTVLEIEGDDSGAGVIDAVLPVGTTNAGGYWIDSEDMENGTITILLVENFSGSVGDDLDTNNDGTFDSMPWTRIVDDVAVTDGGSSDQTYSSTVLGPFFDGNPFGAGGASRIPNGTDTDTTGDWVRNDFDGFGFPGFPGSPAVGEAENTPDAVNAAITVFTDPIGVCGDAATLIHDIQGNGLASTDVGSIREIEGIVTGDFEDGTELNGFFMQEETGDFDGDSTTSEGIFVFNNGLDTVNPGDTVRVRGAVQEFFNRTEITNVSRVLLCSSGDSVDATELTLPVSSLDDFEAYEGMLVTLPQALYISEYFNFDRFGEIVLTTERQFQPTATYEPGSPEAADLALANSLSRITLDDGRGSSNPDPAIHPNGNIFDLTNLFRGGEIVYNITGALDYNFGLYKIQPTQGADYISDNPRPVEPNDIGGNLKVASFNVLNYFTTIDDSGPICGPARDQDCRGADTALEFERQRNKIISALAAMNADVVGLIEIENHPGDVPTADLVSGLNNALGLGTYDYIVTGAIGSDAIRQALIYKLAKVSPVGDYAILDSSVDSRFLDDKNRPVLAQTFQDNATGGIFTVAVNHLKSKGSACDDVGDPDTGDGSGNCNLTRKAAAEALVDWLASDPTSSGDPDFLIIGDLNSYDKEDPIDAIKAGSDDAAGSADDYTDLVYAFEGENAYSYVFDGQLGYLDHALANSNLLNEVTGTTIWHINADEPDLIDYDMTFKADAQDALYEPNAYRSSDHDPVIIGLDVCDEIAPTLEVTVTPDTLWPANHKYVTVEATVIATDNFDPNPTVTLISVTSNEPDNGADDGNTVNDIVIIDDFKFKLRAERSGVGLGRVYTITYRVSDVCGNETVKSATVFVPLNQMM